MRGSVHEYRAVEIKENTTPCKAVDNLFNYEYKEAVKKYESVGGWFDSEEEFNAAKRQAKKQIA